MNRSTTSGRWVSLLIIAAGTAAYLNSGSGPFIFDDVPAIVNNPAIRSLWPPSNLLASPRDTSLAGRPVAHLTMTLNYLAGGLQVWSYHVVNVVLHLTTALLLFGVVRRTLLSPGLRNRYGSETSWLAGAVAVIWVVHPLTTESVTYILQRTEVLMGVFFLLTLYGVIRGFDPSTPLGMSPQTSRGVVLSLSRDDDSGAPGPSTSLRTRRGTGSPGGLHSSRPSGWYGAAVAACALGMGSKEVMVVAPILTLLYDALWHRASLRQTLRRRRGVYLGLFGTWLLLAWWLLAVPHSPAIGWHLPVVPAWRYALTQLGVIVYYLRLACWPHPLSIDYADWPVAATLAEVASSALLVGLLLAGTALLWRRRSWLGFLGAWGFLILAPTSSVLPITDEIVAERRMYLPLCAVVTLAVVGGWTLLKRLPMRAGRRSRLALGVVGGLALVFGSMTARRNEAYRSEISIWRDVVTKRPGNARAHNNLGAALGRIGQLDQALAHFQQAVDLTPREVEARDNLGLALLRRGETEEAAEHFREALRLRPEDAVAHNHLGVALSRQGRFDEAIEHYATTIRLRPGYAEAYNNLGNALARQGHGEQSRQAYHEALRLNPDDPVFRDNIERTRETAQGLSASEP